MATRIIAVLNQKGGVGKTTTCVNLGAALALRGQQVLLIDMDPQANMSVHLGLDPGHGQPTSYSVLLGDTTLPESMVETATPGLRMVPSTLALANAEIQLASAVGRELILTEAIQGWLQPEPDLIPDPFRKEPEVTAPPADFVLIDCPPSLGILTMNALCAATDVLLPIQTEFFALQGVRGILESLKSVQRLNKGLQLSIVLPSMVDHRTNLARDVIDDIRGFFGPRVTRTMIRKNVKLAEAPSHGQTIFEYDRSSRGAEDYAALADEILGIEPGEEAPEAAAGAPDDVDSDAPADDGSEPEVPTRDTAHDAPRDDAADDAAPTSPPVAREPEVAVQAAAVAAVAVIDPAREAPAEPSPVVDAGTTAEPVAVAADTDAPSPANAAPPSAFDAGPDSTTPDDAAPGDAAPAFASASTRVPAHVVAEEPAPFGSEADAAASDDDFARALEVTTAVEEATTTVSLPVPAPPAPAPSVPLVEALADVGAYAPFPAIDIDEVREPAAPTPPSASVEATWMSPPELPVEATAETAPETTSEAVAEPAGHPGEEPHVARHPHDDVIGWSTEPMRAPRAEPRIGLPGDPVESAGPADPAASPRAASGTPLGYSATVHSLSPPPAPARNRIEERVGRDGAPSSSHDAPFATDEHDTGELDTAAIETGETDPSRRD